MQSGVSDVGVVFGFVGGNVGHGGQQVLRHVGSPDGGPGSVEIGASVIKRTASLTRVANIASDRGCTTGRVALSTTTTTGRIAAAVASAATVASIVASATVASVVASATVASVVASSGAAVASASIRATTIAIVAVVASRASSSSDRGAEPSSTQQIHPSFVLVYDDVHILVASIVILLFDPFTSRLAVSRVDSSPRLVHVGGFEQIEV
ncbi:hypothetical protein [Cyprinid herpesvirus 2]|nr:hypothetical protein [Cyprinid herpesvirus 2]